MTDITEIMRYVTKITIDRAEIMKHVAEIMIDRTEIMKHLTKITIDRTEIMKYVTKIMIDRTHIMQHQFTKAYTVKSKRQKLSYINKPLNICYLINKKAADNLLRL